MTNLRFIFRATLAAPLALALAACGSNGEETTLESEPLDPIEAPAGTSWVDTVAVTPQDGYMLGNPDAPIKLIEYASLTCGACANFAATGVEPLKDDFVSTGLVSYELRNQIHNVVDLTLARMVRCSAPASFHPLADQVWANLGEIQGAIQANEAALSSAVSMPADQRYVAVAQGAGLLDFFAARGVSTDQAVACLSDAEAVEAIGIRSDEQSEELGVSATPTFILNGEVLDVRSWSELEPVLRRAGARPPE